MYRARRVRASKGCTIVATSESLLLWRFSSYRADGFAQGNETDVLSVGCSRSAVVGCVPEDLRIMQKGTNRDWLVARQKRAALTS